MVWFVAWGAPYSSPAICLTKEEAERFESMRQALGEKLRAEWSASGRDLYLNTAAAGRERLNYATGGPDWPKFRSEKGPTLSEGWRWPVPNPHFRSPMRSVPKVIKDIICGPNAYAVSERVIDIIERIEPGVHQFLPHELIAPDGSVHPERRWLLNVCTRVQAIDPERSDVVVDPLGLFAQRPYSGPLVFRKEETERRAIWEEYRYCFGRTIISDRFWAGLQRAGCKGWKPIHGSTHMAEV